MYRTTRRTLEDDAPAATTVSWSPSDGHCGTAAARRPKRRRCRRVVPAQQSAALTAAAAWRRNLENDPGVNSNCANIWGATNGEGPWQEIAARKGRGGKCKIKVRRKKYVKKHPEREEATFRLRKLRNFVARLTELCRARHSEEERSLRAKIRRAAGTRPHGPYGGPDALHLADVRSAAKERGEEGYGQRHRSVEIDARHCPNFGPNSAGFAKNG